MIGVSLKMIALARWMRLNDEPRQTTNLTGFR